tara:strand:- start:207 stop:332 length:126 start_codon:yes stop_codon:yes gene_type:complete
MGKRQYVLAHAKIENMLGLNGIAPMANVVEALSDVCTVFNK